MLHGMDQTLPMFWFLHAFPIFHWLLPFLAPIIARINANMKEFLDFRACMAAQIDELLKNPELLDRADHEIVYHHLMTPQINKGQYQIPSRTSLWHEVKTLSYPCVFSILTSFYKVDQPHVCRF
jgi:hypothetical protein